MCNDWKKKSLCWSLNWDVKPTKHPSSRKILTHYGRYVPQLKTPFNLLTIIDYMKYLFDHFEIFPNPLFLFSLKLLLLVTQYVEYKKKNDVHWYKFYFRLTWKFQFFIFVMLEVQLCGMVNICCREYLNRYIEVC